jgi:hypothetical protein
MCVTLSPAILSETKVYAGLGRWNGREVHVLGYQNTAQHLGDLVDGRFTPEENADLPRGNAMILAFPTRELMGPANVLDTTRSRRILSDMARAVLPMSRMRTPLGDDGGRAMSFSVQVFDHGIYTTVTGHDPQALHAALARVPSAKRPPLSAEMLEFYGRTYKGWQIFIECFDNTEAIESDPLLYRFVPAFPDMLFVPTLESHSGAVPDAAAKVSLDHAIMVGAPDGKGQGIGYSDVLIDEIRQLLPTNGMGRRYHQAMPNGDFVFRSSETAQGKFDPIRAKPGTLPAINPAA